MILSFFYCFYYFTQTKFLTKVQHLKVASAHLYGILYFAASVWLNPLKPPTQMKLLNSIR